MTMTSLIKRFSVLLFTAAFAFMAGCAGGPKQESTGEYVDDSAITAKVKTALIQDPEVKATDVKVETYKGVVQLSGFANSEKEINKAVQVARDVQGVKSVKNDIRIKGGS
jgi:osmotically-inducible protein OsmY